MPGVAQIGLTHHRVLTHYVVSVDGAALGGVDHFHRRQARHGGERCIPSGFELGANFVITNALVAGEDIGKTTGVGTTLDVVLAAQGIQSRAGATEVAGEQGQVGQGSGVIRAMDALADAHAPVDSRTLGAGVEPGCLPDLVRGYTADLIGPLGRATI